MRKFIVEEIIARKKNEIRDSRVESREERGENS
jgi:hypothetical protein